MFYSCCSACWEISKTQQHKNDVILFIFCLHCWIKLYNWLIVSFAFRFLDASLRWSTSPGCIKCTLCKLNVFMFKQICTFHFMRFMSFCFWCSFNDSTSKRHSLYATLWCHDVMMRSPICYIYIVLIWLLKALCLYMEGRNLLNHDSMNESELKKKIQVKWIIINTTNIDFCTQCFCEPKKKMCVCVWAYWPIKLFLTESFLWNTLFI